MKIYQSIIIWLAALFIFGCDAMQPTASPTDTIKTFSEATIAKDTQKIQSLVSKNTLDMMQKTAQKQNTTVDALLSRDIGTPVTEIPETRNEQIEGDTATVEVKNAGGGDFDTIPLVKEDGKWKIALDKFIEDARKRGEEQLKMAQQNSNTAAGNQTNANTSQPEANK